MITTFATFDLAHDAGRTAVAGLAGWTFTVHPHGPFGFAVMLTCAETGAPLGWLTEVEEVEEIDGSHRFNRHEAACGA